MFAKLKDTKIFSDVVFLKFHNINLNLGNDPFQVNFCIWYEVRVNVKIIFWVFYIGNLILKEMF